jgi:hypothetical protein
MGTGRDEDNTGSLGRSPGQVAVAPRGRKLKDLVEEWLRLVLETPRETLGG